MTIKRFLIFGCLVLLGIFVIYVFFAHNAKNIYNAEEISNQNLYNDSTDENDISFSDSYDIPVCIEEDGDILYWCSDNNIYKQSQERGNEEICTDKYISDLYVTEDYIYYCAKDENAVERKIIMMNKDGSVAKILDSGHIYNLYVGDYILYEKDTVEAFSNTQALITEYSIYRMDLDGNNSQCIISLPVNAFARDIYPFRVYENYIYYIDPDTKVLWRADVKGSYSNAVKIADKLAYNDNKNIADICKDKVYYLKYADENFDLYRMNTSGLNSEFISENVSEFEVIGDLLIYNNAIHNEDGKIIADFPIANLYSIGNSENCIYFKGDNATYRYNIKDNSFVDISELFKLN